MIKAPIFENLGKSKMEYPNCLTSVYSHTWYNNLVKNDSGFGFLVHSLCKKSTFLSSNEHKGNLGYEIS